MAEWWLLGPSIQRAIASHIDAAAARVVQHFDAHANENGLTAAFGQELVRSKFAVGHTSVEFEYRKFPEQSEEHLTGADGGFIISVETPEETVTKGVLFQAKRYSQNRRVRAQTVRLSEARRLRQQLARMNRISDECIVLAHTRADIYAVDALAANDLPMRDLCRLLQHSRVITIGTYLGSWVARCTRGDLRQAIVSQIRSRTSQIVEMNVRTRERPLLTEGGQPIDIASSRGRTTAPRWRRPS